SREVAMTPTLFILFILFSAALGNPPCVDFSTVCVPAQAIERGCHCALIRPGQEESTRQAMREMLGRSKRHTAPDSIDDIKLVILNQNSTDELNRVFPHAESTPVGYDNNVFATMKTQAHSSLMTVPK
ncbi:hypothetical protein PMAYCL1PPCAC_08765, partial [Pristionchus mayeri]